MTLEWLWRQLKDGCTHKNCSRDGELGAELNVNGRLVCKKCRAYEVKKRKGKLAPI